MINIESFDLEIDLPTREWLCSVAGSLGVKSSTMAVGSPRALGSMLERAGAGFSVVSWVTSHIRCLLASEQCDPLLREALAGGHGVSPPLLAMVDGASGLGPARPVRFICGRKKIPGVMSLHDFESNVVIAETTALLGWDLWLGWYAAALGESNDARMVEKWLGSSGKVGRGGSASTPMLDRIRAFDAVEQCCHWFIETRRHDRFSRLLTTIGDPEVNYRSLVLKDLESAVELDVPSLIGCLSFETPFAEAHRLAIEMSEVTG